MLILKTEEMEKDDFVNLFNDLNISNIQLLELAKNSGFIERIRKIDSLDFMYSLAKESMQGIASYNDIAAALENDNVTSISRQAICKKVTDMSVHYFKRVLELVIISKLSKANEELISGEIRRCKFNRVLVQDSTIIRIPRRLFEFFCGVSNGSSTVCNARIQGIYDLLTEQFVSFTIDSYSKNDQASAPEMEITKGDLTLRDRGYLTMDEIKRHFKLGAHCIYRHNVKSKFLDFDTDQPIDLLALLNKEGSIDKLMKLNNKEKTIVRVVAQRVDGATADSRRRKAKKEMKGHNPSKLFLELQSWTIFITTIPSEQADFNTLLKIYGLRWRIEIIFKAWKSNMHFDRIQNVSKNQLIITILMRMIMFLLITQIIYNPFKRYIFKHLKRTLSLLKLIKYIIRNPSCLKQIWGEKDNFTKIISRHCVYEKRNRRQNFDEKMNVLYA